MKLTKSGEHVAVVPSGIVESLCSSCIYSGSFDCPDRFDYFSFSKDKYPHVNEYHLSGIALLVDDCDCYIKRGTKKKFGKNSFI